MFGNFRSVLKYLRIEAAGFARMSSSITTNCRPKYPLYFEKYLVIFVLVSREGLPPLLQTVG